MHMQTVWNRVTMGLLAFIALALLVVMAMLATRAYGGPLDPANPPGSTLPLVEPRTPISQPASAAGFPIVISQPGSYYLATNITGVAPKAGISIQSSGVTLDLNGFQLIGVGGSLSGITVPNFVSNVSVRNGVVRSWGGTGIEAGVVTGGMFTDLQVTNNGNHGLVVGSANLVSNVEARVHPGSGIFMANVGAGGLIINSVASFNGYGVTLLGNNVTIRDSVLNNNTVAGVDIGGAVNRIERNEFQTNGVGVRILGNANIIVRNLVVQAAGTAYSNLGANNHIGGDATIGTNTVSSTNVWSNVYYAP